MAGQTRLCLVMYLSSHSHPWQRDPRTSWGFRTDFCVDTLSSEVGAERSTGQQVGHGEASVTLADELLGPS